MAKYVDELCPIVIDMLQDASSFGKREIAIWTLGQLVENTGYDMYVTVFNVINSQCITFMCINCIKCIEKLKIL